MAETINLNATQTPLPESSDLLTSMVTAISAAAAITAAAARVLVLWAPTPMRCLGASEATAGSHCAQTASGTAL
jgi:hypothetical protein